MVLRQMQGLLAHCYDVQSDYDIYDFLATDRSQLNLPTQCSDEQVLVAENAAGVGVSVFIDAEVLRRLSRNNPLSDLNDENLADYCTALEGVSHFNYLTWRMARGLSVSLLELELQAEVDKYIGAMVLMTRQQQGNYPRGLHRQLFDRFTLVDGLDTESIARYRMANRNAARYCRKLDEQYLQIRCKRPEAWLLELRRFYRCGHAEKVRRSQG